MTRSTKIGGLAIGLGGLLVLFGGKFLVLERLPATVFTPAEKREVIPRGIIVTESSPAIPPPVSSIPTGERILADYANPATTPQRDLALMGQMISSFLTLFKRAADRPLSANEEWSAALRGQRADAEPWLREGHRSLDAQGRLIDRWQTPLHFHALGQKQWEIRSAGPDRQLWTSDDLLEKTGG
jgi:hypothetical protein